MIRRLRTRWLARWAVGALVLLLVTGCGAQRQEESAAPTGGTDDTAIESTPATAEASPTTLTEASYQNPVFRQNFPDPFVLEEDGTYYAYATNGTSRNIQMARSTDLVKWQMLSDAMPSLPSWARLSDPLVWAPEVIKIGEQYLLYYTARDKESDKQCLGVAVADSPEGKFRDSNDAPLVCQAEEGGTIDASPFLDGDKLYLYYKNDGNCCNMATYLYVQEMTPDGLGFVGDSVRLVRNDTAWEGHVVEAPTMWKHEDQYYLFFSGNNYGGFEYAVGYATCEGPMGPCEDAPENPTLASTRNNPPVIGPGHQTLIQIGEETWMVYHAWDVLPSGTRGNSRYMWIDRVTWENGAPEVLGPSQEPQPAPAE